MDIHPIHLTIIQHILNKHLSGDVNVWVFGSRAKHTADQSSDLDLALEGEDTIGVEIITRLNCDFEDSDLPYEVDVLDIAMVNANFQKIIKRDRVFLERKSVKPSHR